MTRYWSTEVLLQAELLQSQTLEAESQSVWTQPEDAVKSDSRDWEDNKTKESP